MKHFSLALLIFLLALATPLSAQLILTPLDAPETMIACGAAESFTVSVINADNVGYSNLDFIVDLPPGMEYLAGTVQGPVVETNINDPGRPQFRFNSLAALSTQEVVIDAIINCAFTNERGPIYELETPTGFITSQEQPLANFFFPEVVITDIDNPVLNLAVAATGTRTFTIIQSTVGARLDTLFFVNRYEPGMEPLGLNLGTLIGSSPGIDTFMVTGVDLPGGNQTFDAGDTLRLTETVRLLDCAPANSSIELYWRCGQVICQSFLANTILTQATGAPDLRITNTNGFADQTVANNPSLVGGGFCDTLQLSYLLENLGGEDAPGAGAVYDLVLGLGLNNNLFSSSLPFDLGIFPNWSLQVELNGNLIDLGTYHYPAPNPLLGYNLNFSQLTSDPDGPGGLDDIDGDGFFDDLAVGASTQLVVYIVYDPYATDGCAFLSGYPYNGGAETNFRLGYLYRDQCDEDRSYWYSVNDIGTNVVSLFTHRAITYTLSLTDYNLEPGDISLLEVRPDGAWNSPCAATDSFVLELVLPDGLVPEPIAIGPGNFDGIVGISGDTVWLASDERGNLSQPWGIGLSIDCSEAIVDTTLEVSFLYYCAPDCGPPRRINCQELILDYLPQCDPCLNGIDTRDFIAERRSLGWINTAHTEQVDPADPIINLEAGINRDSVSLTLHGVYRGSPPFNDLRARISYKSIDPAFVDPLEPHFTPRDALVEYYPTTGGLIICPLSDFTTSYDATEELHRIEVDIEPLFQNGGCLAGINRVAGDSIVLRVLSIVTDNTPRRALPIPEFRGQFYLWNNGTIISCNEYLDNFLLEEVVPNANLAYPNQEHYGCAPINFNNNSIANPGHIYDRDQFPNEVRSIVDVSEVRMILEGNWQHEAGSSELLANGSFDEDDTVSDNAPFVTVPLTDPAVSFDGQYTTFTYVNDGSWPEGDLVIGGSNPIHNIQFLATPGCLVPSGEAFTIRMEADMIRYLNAPPERRDTITSVSINENKIYQGPRADLLPASPQEFIPDSDTVRWEMDINNATSYGHPDKLLQHVWLAIEGAMALSDVTFEDVTDPDNPIPLLVQSYNAGDGYWVQLGEVDPFSTRRIRISAVYRECDPQTLIASLGHSCIDYPNPHPGLGYQLAGTAFFCPEAEVELSILPRPVSLNVNIEGPPLPAPLCEPLDYAVLVSNANLPTAYQHLLETRLPLGAEIIPGTSRIEIPANSGNWQPLNDPAALPGNSFLWDMEADPNGVRQLTGVDEVPNNAYRIAFQILTRCGFNAGLRVGFRATAQNNCGLLEERAAFSERLLIEGLPENINNYALSIDLPEMGLDACDTSDVNIKLINLGPESSLELESAVVTLPGAFDLIDNGIAGNTSLLDNQLLQEERLLRFQIPPGIPPGDSLVFSIQLADTRNQTLDCIDREMSLAVLLESDVACSLSPTDSCSIFLVLNSDTIPAPILKDDLSLELVEQRSVPLGTTGETLTTILKLLNNQSVTARTDTIIWEVYVDEDASGTLDLSVDQLLYSSPERPVHIPAGEAFLDSITYNALSEQVCQLIITYRNTGESCSCEPPDIIVWPNPVLANAGEDQLVCSDEPVWLGTDNRQGNITFTWTALSLGGQSAISPLDSAFAEFLLPNPGTNSATYLFQLQTNRGPNCESTDTVVVTVLPEIRPTVSVVSDYNGQEISCAGSTDGILQVNAGLSTAPVNYELSGMTQTNPIFDSLGVGNYTFNIIDANGCLSTVSGTLTEPDSLSWNATASPVSCFGGNNGLLEVQASGGTPTYSYAWSNGGDNNPLHTDLSSGWYQVSITDLNDCQIISDSLWVDTPDPIGYLSSQDSTTCSYSLDGIFSLDSIGGGTMPYTISWSDGTSGTQNNNLPVGPDSLLIVDDNGCEEVVHFNISGPPALQVAGAELNDLSCFGIPDGSISVTVLGGTLPYHFDWSNGDSSAQLTNLLAGDYVLTVTDEYGCLLISDPYTLVEPPSLAITNAAIEGVTCFGLADGSLDIEAGGGTPPYTYSWDAGQAGGSLSSLATGTYQVIVSDANDCQIDNSYFVPEPAPLDMVVEQEPPACFGDPGLFRIFADGGTQPYSYSIDNGNTLQSEPLFSVGPGEYELLVQDANDCELMETVEMREPLPLYLQAPEEIVLNYGDSIDLLIPVYNVRGDTIVKWLPNGPYLSCQDCLNPRLYALESTLLQITVDDSYGCRAEALIRLIVERPRRVYLPNAFSPDGKGDNNLLYPFGAGEVEEILRLDIFNRWGGLMYSRNNFPPNDPTYGWDGHLRGQPLPAAVYVYYMEVRFTDGTVIPYSGDVVLVR
ncbi:MAG: gliding motility-associated C-terminal domain-containing protein [Bacteroidota bacterium]